MVKLGFWVRCAVGSIVEAWRRVADRVEWWATMPRKFELARRMYWLQVEQTHALEKTIAELRAGDGRKDLPLDGEETARLARLVEACGRTAQTAAMALRFGWHSESPYSGKTNRFLIEREIGQLRAIADVMTDAGDVRRGEIREHRRRMVFALKAKKTEGARSDA